MSEKTFRPAPPGPAQGRRRRRSRHCRAGQAQCQPRPDRGAPLPVHLAAARHLPRIRAGLRDARERHGGRAAAPGAAGRRRGGGRVPAPRRGLVRHLGWRARRLRLLVRQEQGVQPVRHRAALVRRRQPDARLVLLRRRRGALQGAAGRRPEGERGRLPDRPDADPTARLVQAAGGAAGAAPRHEVPHRRPRRRPVQRDGRGGHLPPGRRDRAGAGARRDRRGGVQQPVLRPRARLPRRRQGLHDPELPPAGGMLRGPVQQGQVRGPAGRAAGDPAIRRGSRPRPT